MPDIRKSDEASNEIWDGKHKFEHWYRDNQVYFITARCRDKFPAFASEAAKGLFWKQFEKAIHIGGFQPWVTSLLDNHYHTIGYLECGEKLAPMMKALHGGASKLVNDFLRIKLLPFWVDSRRKNYFDGCLRDEKQGRLTYLYVRGQAVRHGIVQDWREYPHTRVCIELEQAIAFALERNAFLKKVPYKRYEQQLGRRTEVRLPSRPTL
ncbi:MAG: hypothetical protein L0219_06040 [Phycisphaerales bacterium]|nr:hypothetical protein [Phycisphaerales bacterium]